MTTLHIRSMAGALALGMTIATGALAGCGPVDGEEGGDEFGFQVAETEQALTGYALDGTDPNACATSSTVTKATKDLVVSYLGSPVNEGKVSLKYSPSCKTFWAKIELARPVGADGFAQGEVVRLGNHKKTLKCNVAPGKTWCYTPQLYNDGSDFIGQIFLKVWNGSSLSDTRTVTKGDLTSRVRIPVGGGSAAKPGDLGTSYSGNAVVLADELNIRLGPGTDAWVAYTVKKGEVLNVRRMVDSNWAFVGYNDSRPIYASAWYLKAVETPPEPAAQTWGLQGTRRPPQLAIALNTGCQVGAGINVGYAEGIAIDASLNTAVLHSKSIGLETSVGCALGFDLTIMRMPSVDGFAGTGFDIGASGGTGSTFGLSMVRSDDGYFGMAATFNPVSFDLNPIPLDIHVKRTYTEVQRVEGEREEQIRNTIQTYLNGLNKKLPRSARQQVNDVLGGELLSPN